MFINAMNRRRMHNQQFNHVAPSGLQVYIIYVLPAPRQKNWFWWKRGGQCALFAACWCREEKVEEEEEVEERRGDGSGSSRSLPHSG